MFVVGRLLAGIGIGMATCCQGVYLTEISPIRFRGQIGMLMGCATASGFFLV
jgi:MFS family permease